MKQILGFDEAMEILAPYYNSIIEAMKGGFDDFSKVLQLSAEHIHPVEFQNRTKANLVHDYIAQRIVNLFHDKQGDGIKTGKFSQIFGVLVDSKVFIRFKKMDKYFNVSNYRTPQHKKYMHQRPIEGLSTEPTYLFAGYIPDASWAALSGIYVACWNGEVLQWIDEAGKRHSEQMVLKFDFKRQSIHGEIERKIKLNAKVININKDNSGTKP
jgi:hypothetical protein